MKKVVITGVSTGIGYSSAKILCNSGYAVYGSVRKNEDADRIADKLGENFHPLIFDVRDEDAIKESALQVEEIAGNKGIDYLTAIKYDKMIVLM